jgi:hypothetical protein
MGRTTARDAEMGRTTARGGEDDGGGGVRADGRGWAGSGRGKIGSGRGVFLRPLGRSSCAGGGVGDGRLTAVVREGAWATGG